MKLKNARIIVESFGQLDRRWSKALRGKLKSDPNEEVISVPSVDVLGKVLSAPRIEILLKIPTLKPRSINALAKALKKNFKNVYNDVQFLSGLGLIELESSGRTAKPVAKFKKIEFALAA